MRRLAGCLLLFPLLSSCGVVLPYIYDATKLDEELSGSMSKQQVVSRLGKPDRVVHGDQRQTIWEYRLYSRGEWRGYLIHCPFHPYCYFPAEPPSPYYVAFQDNQLCLWGTPFTVRTLVWKVCGPNVADGLRAGHERMKEGLAVSVIPVFMPPRLSAIPQRLAVVPMPGVKNQYLTSWLDLTLNFIRSRHPQLVLVEREDLETVFGEVGLQYTGRVDEDTMVKVGRLTGATSLLTYRLGLIEGTESLSASFDVRLVHVENGTTQFRQITTAVVNPPRYQTTLARPSEPSELAHRIAIEEATAYGLAALASAFGDNPIGIVPDQTWPHEGVKLLGVLQGSPADLAGIKPGDRIVMVNGQPSRNWTEPISIPSQLTIERDEARVETSVTANTN